jgi:hypothetical protein
MRVLAAQSKRIEEFLLSLANIHGLAALKAVGPEEGFDKPMRRLMEHFPDFIPKVPEHPSAEGTLFEFLSAEERQAYEKMPAVARGALWLQFISSVLGDAWLAQDSRTRAWKMFVLKNQVLHMLMPNGWLAPVNALPPPVTLTPFWQAIERLESQSHRALRCKNPDCPTPFFFVNRKGQEYCSDDCRKPARAASKRRWWTQYGSNWTKNRRKRSTKRAAVR